MGADDQPVARFVAGAGDDAATGGGDALRLDVQGDDLTGKLNQLVALFGGHVNRGNVEIAVFDEGEGVAATGQFRIPAGGGNNGLGLLCFQQVDNVAVVVRVVERKIFGHQLLLGQLAAQEDDFLSRVYSFQLGQG